jgi:hypothetical protein
VEEVNAITPVQMYQGMVAARALTVVPVTAGEAKIPGWLADVDMASSRKEP